MVDHLTTIKRALALVARRPSRNADEDTLQEAALRVHLAKSAVRSPHAFVAKVVRNLIVDEARKVRARGGVAIALQDLPPGQLPSVQADQEISLLVRQVILGLPPIYRDVFILNRYVGLSHAEIATRFGISAKTVEYRMSRALALCREALRD